MSDKSDLSSSLPALATLTPEQKTAMEVARVAFMNACPFFCYYFYSEMIEYPTLDIQSAATDGRRIFYNPRYIISLKPSERVFLLAHEVNHAVMRHPARMKYYSSEGKLRDSPWSQELFNICADFVINRCLVDESIGTINRSWLFEPSVEATDLVEDVYEKYIKNVLWEPQLRGVLPSPNLPTYDQTSVRKATGAPDKTAQDHGGRFDEVLPPRVDPVTGREDAPGEAEFKEAVARAATAAKAIGRLPASMQRMVDEVLEPQVNWRDHIRMLVTGKIGSQHETWDRPNRRAVVLNAIFPRGYPFTPGRKGYGADVVAVAVDVSGSIGAKELSVFFAEIGGILADVRPRTIMVFWCDDSIRRVDEVSSLAELEQMRMQGSTGGGGTDFRPPFKYLAESCIRPEALIYLTDMLGPFPDKAPSYPVIWCSSLKVGTAPFGDVVEISV